MSKNERKYPKGSWMSVGISIGIAIGVALGPIFDNIGIGIALGVAIGSGIGGFHKSPFERMVGLFKPMPKADFASTAFHSRYSACITRQLLSPRKPFHTQDRLRANHNGENIARARDGFEESHVGSQNNTHLSCFNRIISLVVMRCLLVGFGTFEDIPSLTSTKD